MDVMMVDRSGWDQSFLDTDLAQHKSSSSTILPPIGTAVDDRLAASGFHRCQQTAVWVSAGNTAAAMQHQRHQASKIPSSSSAFYQNGHVAGVESRRLNAGLDRTCSPLEVAVSSASDSNVCRTKVVASLSSNSDNWGTTTSESSSSSSSSAELGHLSISLIDNKCAPTRFDVQVVPTSSADVDHCCSLKQSSSSAHLLDVDHMSATTPVCRSSSSPNCFDDLGRLPSPSCFEISSVANRMCSGTPVATPGNAVGTRTTAAGHVARVDGEPVPTAASSSYSVVANFLPAWDMERLDQVYRRLAASGFYVGRMSVDEAARRLASWPVGSFLLRDSSDRRYLFSVSVQTCRGTTSVRMAYRSGLFRLDCHPDQEHLMPTFDCALRLLRHYVGLCRRATSTGNASDSSSELPSSTAVPGTAAVTGGHGYVLLETTGRRDTPVLLRTPYRERPSSLAHMCRVTINKSVVKGGHQTTSGSAAAPAIDRLQLLPSLKNFLKDYPYDF